MRFQFKNRWVLLTGASAGIGKALALALAARGCNLFLVARRASLLEELASQIESRNGVQVRWLSLDLTTDGAVECLLRETKEVPISILINNAGFGMGGAFENAQTSALKSMIDLNVSFTLLLTRAFLPRLQAWQGEARVMNLGSIAGYQGVVNMAAYAGSKAFVNTFSEGLAWELRGSNIKVCCLQPGSTASEFFQVAGMEGSRMSRVGVMSSEVVAEQGVALLASGKPKRVTGWVNRIRVFSLRFSPRFLVRLVINRLFRDLG